jgi:hypothetical protein
MRQETHGISAAPRAPTIAAGEAPEMKQDFLIHPADAT